MNSTGITYRWIGEQRFRVEWYGGFELLVWCPPETTAA